MNILLITGSIILGSAGAWFMSRYAFRFGLIDQPNERSSHSISTPRGGGIGILFAFLIVGFFFPKYYFFIFVSALMGIIGFLADRHDVLPKVRLLAQLIVSTIVVISFNVWPTSVAWAMLFLFWIL